MSIGSFFSSVGRLAEAAAPVVSIFNPAAGAATLGAAKLASALPGAASGVGSLFRKNDARTALAVITSHINRFTKQSNSNKTQKGNR